MMNNNDSYSDKDKINLFYTSYKCFSIIMYTAHSYTKQDTSKKSILLYTFFQNAGLSIGVEKMESVLTLTKHSE